MTQRGGSVCEVGAKTEAIPRFFPLFDVMRILLALEVVRCHYGINLGYGFGDILTPVPMFLALSGFMVLQSFEHSRNWGHFAWKRALRIVPLYVTTLIAILFLFGASEVKGNLLCYASSGFAGTWKNGVVWSLGAEELAYLTLAILYIKGAYRAIWPIWIGVIISAAFMLYTDYPGIARVNDALYRVQCLPFCFFVGNLAYVYRAWLLRAGWIGVVLVLCGVFIRMHIELAAIPALFAAPGLILVGLHFRPKWKAFPDFSYGTYLWHELLFSAIPSSKTIALLITAVVVVVSRFAIETPFLKFKNWTLNR